MSGSGKDYSVMDRQNKHREKVEIETMIDNRNKKRGKMADWTVSLRNYGQDSDTNDVEIVRVHWPYRGSNTTIN